MSVRVSRVGLRWKLTRIVRAAPSSIAGALALLFSKMVVVCFTTVHVTLVKTVTHCLDRSEILLCS